MCMSMESYHGCMAHTYFICHVMPGISIFILYGPSRNKSAHVRVCAYVCERVTETHCENCLHVHSILLLTRLNAVAEAAAAATYCCSVRCVHFRQLFFSLFRASIMIHVKICLNYIQNEWLHFCCFSYFRWLNFFYLKFLANSHMV